MHVLSLSSISFILFLPEPFKHFLIICACTDISCITQILLQIKIQKAIIVALEGLHSSRNYPLQVHKSTFYFVNKLMLQTFTLYPRKTFYSHQQTKWTIHKNKCTNNKYILPINSSSSLIQARPWKTIDSVTSLDPTVRTWDCFINSFNMPLLSTSAFFFHLFSGTPSSDH